MSELVYWIWLSLVCTPGLTTFEKLYAEFDTPENIFRASAEEIGDCIGKRSRDYTAICEHDLTRAKEIYDFCMRKQVGLMPYGDPRFPATLARIPSAPALLYYRGTWPDFDEGVYIAVVGSRRMSEYGKNVAFSVSADLATAGATVVSGMARGIDGVAHCGALFGGGNTVAVLGSGIDVCYPPEHLTLARAIVKRGCILTEYAPGTPPNRYNFPPRNRIISGLCSAVVAVEGGAESGALITARHAMAQSKPVYAVPGNVDSPGSALSTALLRDGAKLLTSADDLVRDFEWSFPGVLNPFALKKDVVYSPNDTLLTYGLIGAKPSFGTKKRTVGAKEPSAPAPQPSQPPQPSFDPSGLNEALRAVYERIPAEESIAVDSLVEEDMGIRPLMRALLKLEMLGLVQMLPGERVRRNNSSFI